MEVRETGIAGCLVVVTKTLQDSRGFFLESYKQSAIERTLGRPYRFMQGNHSWSKANVLRGFHTEPWDKLIYVIGGTALCVVADVRPDSPTFGRHERFMLGEGEGERNRIIISEGLSNAFYCFTEVNYVNDVSEEFEPEGRGGVHWADPAIGVDWPCADPILSEKDAKLPGLKDLFPGHLALQG